MEAFGAWVQRTSTELAAMDEIPMDDIYAGQLQEALEAAHIAWRGHREPLDNSHFEEVVHLLIWYGATEYIALITNPDSRSPTYKMTDGAHETERVLELRSTIGAALEALGKRPKVSDLSWWEAFRRLACAMKDISDAKIQFFANELTKGAEGWTKEEIQQRALAYHEHILPLWQALVEHGGLKLSDPARWLPSI